MDRGFYLIFFITVILVIFGDVIPDDYDYEEMGYHPTPYFLPTPTNVTVRAGDLAILPCSIRHLGTKQVAWGRLGDDHFITIGTFTWIKDKRFVIQHRELQGKVTDWNLLIKRVAREYTGDYECQISTKEKIARLVHLNVVGPSIKRSGIILKGKQFVDVGDSIHLICNATASQRIPEEIDWFKEGDKIDSTRFKHIVITKYRSLRDKSLVSELFIDHSTTRDSGMYICRSSEKEINSRKVTVLVADSPNVKREPGRTHADQKIALKSHSNKHGLSTYLVGFVVSWHVRCTF